MRLADVDRSLQEAAAAADAHRRRLAGAQREIELLAAIWHYFRRRRLLKSLGGLRHAVVRADAGLGALHAERTAILAEAAVDFPGLSLPARRNINLILISYAELLCEQVDAFGLAARTKEAVARRVHEMNFGDRAQCEEQMRRVQKAQAAVASSKQVAPALREKLERLRKTCEYRNTADTVPTADSLVPGATDPEARKAGNPGAVPEGPAWNVLAEDYWDLFNVLLR